VTILRQPEAFAWDAVLDDVCTRVTALVKPSRLSGRVQR
jgi:hypothetical protein